MRLVKVTDYERQRRATNVIAIGPRKVVGYAGNARVKREFFQNGLDLIEIEEAELIRGFGGPRCMTMPILRD
jgi:arginine deiminase